MKQPNLHLIYDDDCPLCKAYTGAFVKTGILHTNERHLFSQLPEQLGQHLDIQRAGNEIPLVNPTTGEVWYGIDALLQLLGRRFPIIQRIGECKPVKFGLRCLYSFISYNRRVIVAKPGTQYASIGAPSFNSTYRLLFVLFFLAFNTVLLVPLYHHVLLQTVFYHNSLFQVQMAHALVVLINIGIALSLPRTKALEYIGQVNMLALLVILLFIPLIVLNQYWLINNTALNHSWMGAVACIVVQQYVRRMQYANILPQQKWIVGINLLSVGGFLYYLLN